MAPVSVIVNKCYLHCKDGNLEEMIKLINSQKNISKETMLAKIIDSTDSFFEIATQSDHLHVIDYLLNEIEKNPKDERLCNNLNFNLYNSMNIAIDNKNMKIVNYYLIKKREYVEKWFDYHFIKYLCSNNQVEVLKSLVENKYDINKKCDDNYQNWSNFLDACCFYSVDVMRVYFESQQELFLHLNIIIGPLSHQSAFYFAISRNNLEIVKLLLQFEKYKNEQSPYKNKLLAYMYHAVNEEIVEYLLSLDVFSQQDKIEAMELYGARQKVLENNINSKTYKYWEMALKKRKELNFPKEVSSPLEVFCNAVEFTTLDELQNMNDFDYIYTQSVLVEERLLGPMSPTSVFHITNWGNFDFKKKKLSMAFLRWFYLLENLKCYSNPLFSSPVQFYETLSITMKGLEVLYQNKKADVSFILKNLLKMAKIIFEHVENKIINQRDKLTKQGLDCLIDYFKVISKIIYNENYLMNDINELKRYAKMVLRLKPKDEADRDLIIWAFKFSGKLSDEDNLILLQLADLFIECRIDPNIRDNNNLSLLVHICASYAGIELKNDYKLVDRTQTKPNNILLQNNKLIEKFVDYGAHLDTVVAGSMCAYDYLTKYGLKCKTLKPEICLQCLCANYINKNGIMIKNLPRKLDYFVALHR